MEASNTDNQMQFQQQPPDTGKMSAKRKSMASAMSANKENCTVSAARTKQQPTHGPMKSCPPSTEKSQQQKQQRPPTAPQKTTTTSSSSSATPAAAVRFEVTSTSSSLLSKRRNRSSFSLRGKRKSSFGELQTILHPDVPVESFCNHISPDLPDPVRLRQLMVYCFQRELETNAANASPEVKGKLECLMKDLLMKRINTSWYHRPVSNVARSLKMAENPDNIQLAEQIAYYETVLKRLDQEEQQWQEVMQRKQEFMQRLSSASADKTVSLEDLDISKLSEESKERWIEMAQSADNGMTADDDAGEMLSLATVRQQVDQVHDRLKDIQFKVGEERRQLDMKFRRLIDSTWPDDIWDIMDGDDEESAVDDGKEKGLSKDEIKRGRRRRSEASLVGLERVHMASSRRESLVDPTMSMLRSLATVKEE